MSKGQVVLDHRGQPIQLAPPTFDADTWTQIQEAAAKRRLNQRTPTTATNPLLGIGFCGCEGCPACEGNLKDNGVVDPRCKPTNRKSTRGGLIAQYEHAVSCICREPICGASLAQQISRRKDPAGEVVAEYRSYRCGRTPLNCNGISINAELAELDIAERFLAEHGDDPETRNVFVPGEDNAHELEQVNASIERLRRESDAGLLVTEEDERVYLERLKHLIERRTALEAVPARKAGWTREDTGRTYAQAWAEEPTQESGGLSQYHRQLLLESKIKYILYQSKPYLLALMELPFAKEREPIDIDEANAFFARLRAQGVGYEEANARWEQYLAAKGD
jgi:site-specific DNA recombinase